MKFLTTVFITLTVQGCLLAQNIGVKTGTPNTTLDVNGAAAFREGTALTLANGANNDVALTDFSLFRITGPTTAFSISGFANGTDGRILSVINTTTQILTIKNQALSTVPNQINTSSGVDIIMPPNATASLTYNSSLQKWVLTSAEGREFEKFGIGIVTPAYALDVVAASNAVRIQGLQSGATTDSLVSINPATGVVSMLSPLDYFKNYVKVLIKPTTESLVFSTTLQDDDYFLFNVSPNEKWQFDGILDVEGHDGDIKYAVIIPSGSLLVDIIQEKGDSPSSIPHFMLRSSGAVTGKCDIDGNLGTSATRIWGVVNIGATGGVFKLQWAQNSSNSNITMVKQNSFIKFTRVQ